MRVCMWVAEAVSVCGFVRLRGFVRVVIVCVWVCER